MRLLLMALLLIAQQSALVHAAWHAARGTATAHGQQDPGKAGKNDGGQARLCVFDAVFGHVLGGGACGGTIAGPLLQADAMQVATTPAFCFVARSFPSNSRAPPVLL